MLGKLFMFVCTVTCTKCVQNAYYRAQNHPTNIKGTVSPDILTKFKIRSVVHIGQLIVLKYFYFVVPMTFINLFLKFQFSRKLLVFSSSIFGFKDPESCQCIQKQFPEASTTHINGFLNAAAVDVSSLVLHKASSTFRKPIIMGTSSFQQLFYDCTAFFQG